jgi:diguanylate cyclase (GGDEF)-like protein
VIRCTRPLEGGANSAFVSSKAWSAARVSFDKIESNVAAPGPTRDVLRLSLRGVDAHWILPIAVAVILAVMWAATLNFTRLEHAAAVRDAVMSSRDLLGTYEAQVVRALREIDQTLRLVKYSYELGQKQPLADLKTRSLLPPDLLFVVSVTDREGTIIASTRPRARGSSAAHDYFQALSRDTADMLAIERLSPGPTADRKLQFARRLNTPDGAFSGIVLVSVDAAFFVSGYEVRKLGTQGLLGLVGTDGVFRVRRSGEVQVSGDKIDYAALVSQANDVEGDIPITTAINSWDGVRRYTGARQLYDFPLAVVVGLGESEQLAVARNNARRHVQRAALGSVVVLIVGALLWRLSWQLAQSRRREAQAKIEHAEQVEYLAYHDALTGLPNRSLFSRLLGQLIAQAQRHGKLLAVAFLDLDRFKHINDTLGHQAGDQLLQEVARRLQSCVRGSDVIARLGGDEFVVLLPELVSEQDGANVARKILTSLANPFMLLGQEFRVTASIGISTYPLGGLDEQTLTKNADIAMYHAKEAGKNNYQFYSEQLNASSLERLAIESSLRRALERGEFVLHYQAKRDMVTGQITGMEALLRWQHPDLGMLAPLRFLPIAEETGLIIPIGRWVLETACRQNVLWQHQGLPRTTIAVNLNARQFTDERLLEEIAAVLRTTGMAPGLLELEIAESLLIRDVDRTLDILTRLKTLGVRIAVDDFGTGYSSLSMLQRFPLDTIKIDRSLVGEAVAAGANEHLTDAVIALGRALSLTVVAQGVETRDQVEFLRRHACDELQGFYFTKPVPADQATRLIQAQTLDFTLSGKRPSEVSL